jgi:hypothetical protein
MLYSLLFLFVLLFYALCQMSICSKMWRLENRSAEMACTRLPKRRLGYMMTSTLIFFLLVANCYYIYMPFLTVRSLLLILLLDSRFSDDTGYKKPMLPQYDDPVEDVV